MIQLPFLHPKIIKLYPHLIPYDKQSDWGDQVPHFDKLYQPLQPQMLQPQTPQTAAG